MGEAIAELLGAVVEPVVDAVSGAIGSVVEVAGEAASGLAEGVASVVPGSPGSSTASRRESGTARLPR